MRLLVPYATGHNYAERWLRRTSNLLRNTVAWRRVLGLTAAVPIVVAWALATHNLALDVLPPGATIDRLVLDKSERSLLAYCRGRVVKTYSVALGRQPEGAKRFEGDRKTPEGLYTISGRNAESRFHLALQISYPRPADVENAKRQGKSPGGAIMIHGTPEGFGYPDSPDRTYDWTNGCIAVTNEEIEELWHAVPVGTLIEIRP